MMNPISIIASSRREFEIFLLILCIMAGIGGLINPDSKVADILPHWELYVWYSALSTGGLISLIGVLGKKLPYLYIERIGLTLLAGFGFGYGLALLIESVLLSGITILLFSSVCVVRTLHINSDLRGEK